MTESQLDFESAAYLAKHPSWHLEDSDWKARQVMRAFARAGLQPSRIGEIGCGAGGVLRALHDRLPESTSFVGFETAPEAYALCAPQAEPRLEFVFGSPLGSEIRFDVLCCLDVFEHVEDYIGFLRRLKRLGSNHVFHIPLEITIERLLRRDGFAHVRRKYNHLHHFTRATAIETLVDTGYQVLDWSYTPSEFALPVKSLGQAIARLPRRLAYALHKGLAARTTGGVSLLVVTE